MTIQALPPAGPQDQYVNGSEKMLEATPTKKSNAAADEESGTNLNTSPATTPDAVSNTVPDRAPEVAEPVFSIFSSVEKLAYVYIASLAAFASPVTGAIYYPALNVLAVDLHTSLSNINLSITTYLVCAAGPTVCGTLVLTSHDRYSKAWHHQSSEASRTDMVEGQPTSFASPSSSPPTSASRCRTRMRLCWFCGVCKAVGAAGPWLCRTG